MRHTVTRVLFDEVKEMQLAYGWDIDHIHTATQLCELTVKKIFRCNTFQDWKDQKKSYLLKTNSKALARPFEQHVQQSFLPESSKKESTTLYLEQINCQLSSIADTLKKMYELQLKKHNWAIEHKDDHKRYLFSNSQ